MPRWQDAIERPKVVLDLRVSKPSAPLPSLPADNQNLFSVMPAKAGIQVIGYPDGS